LPKGSADLNYNIMLKLTTPTYLQHLRASWSEI
jgi:hypothetical protein